MLYLYIFIYTYICIDIFIGDKDFKYEIENLIISTPDITHRKLSLGEDKYIVLACDGLYDVFTNKQCMEWLNENNSNQEDMLQEITEKMCHDAIHVRKSKDNVSILIIRIDGHEVETDITENVNANEHDFDGQEAIIMDDLKEDKIYNSTSSNGSAGHSSFSPRDQLHDSLQPTQSDDNNHQQQQQIEKPHKHKFHVVVASDDHDAITDIVNNIELNLEEDDDNEHDIE